jgi:hypothetical protein
VLEPLVVRHPERPLFQSLLVRLYLQMGATTAASNALARSERRNSTTSHTRVSHTPSALDQQRHALDRYGQPYPLTANSEATHTDRHSYTHAYTHKHAGTPTA